MPMGDGPRGLYGSIIRESELPHRLSTKNRVPLITGEYESRLHEYIGGIVRSQGGVAIAIGGIADHVHLLARMR
jgi:hypothetical protein